MNNNERRLRYRCWHRGTREADLLMGNFFDKCFFSLTEKEKLLFNDFVEETKDTDLVYYTMKIKAWPEYLPSRIIEIYEDYINKEKLK